MVQNLISLECIQSPTFHSKQSENSIMVRHHWQDWNNNLGISTRIDFKDTSNHLLLLDNKLQHLLLDNYAKVHVYVHFTATVKGS